VILGGWGGNRGPGAKLWQPTAGFMASVTRGLIAEDGDQLRNPTLVSSSWDIDSCVVIRGDECRTFHHVLVIVSFTV